jgi:hypothetical protein
MNKNHADAPLTTSHQARQENACGKQYTPFGVLAALDQVGVTADGIPCDPCSGSGLIVSAEMVNRAQTIGA